MDSSDEDLSSSYDSDEEGALLGMAPGTLDEAAANGAANGEDREPIYDADAMHERLEDIAWAEEVPWEETQAITSSSPCEVQDVDDDLSRELAFYNQALSSAKEAMHRLQSTGRPWLRPPDYYAEMVKSDEHMAKVREQLVYEQRQIEAADERRKARESKRFQKQLQSERLKAKAQQKKAAIENVSKLRKQREKSGFDGDFDFDAELAAMEQQEAKRAALQRGSQQWKQQKETHQTGKKRAYKNEKFGFGGKKRGSKRNDASSAATMDDYRGSGGSGRGGGKGGGGRGGGGRGGGRGGGTFGPQGGRVSKKKAGGAGAAANRPGKARRAAMKGGDGKKG